MQEIQSLSDQAPGIWEQIRNTSFLHPFVSTSRLLLSPRQNARCTKGVSQKNSYPTNRIVG